jgi:hypothetical protein
MQFFSSPITQPEKLPLNETAAAVDIVEAMAS